MKAAVLKGDGSLAVQVVERPVPQPGEVLLRVRNCGICGSDLHAAKHPQQMPPDTIMGHEFSAEVAEVGPDVSGWVPGERVVSLPYMSCGNCEACACGDGIFCPRIRGIGLGQLPGAYAEYVRTVPGSLLRIPPQVSFRDAALVEPLAVGLHGVRYAGVGPGSACVIMGAGPIGLVTLLWARLEGADPVVVSDPAPGRARLAQQLGASAVVDPGAVHPADRVRELCGRDPDAVLECVGVKGTLNAALGLARARGTIVVLGVCMEMDEISPLTGILKELTVRFALGYSRAEFEAALTALRERRLDVGPLVTDVVGIDEVPRAFAALARPSTQAKVLIEFT